jgi:hypothetical protein
MYSVVHENHIKTASVRLMGKTKAQAIRIWEGYNPGSYFKDARKDGWRVVKHEVKII